MVPSFPDLLMSLTWGPVFLHPRAWFVFAFSTSRAGRGIQVQPLISPASEHKTETEGVAYNQDIDQNPGFVKLRKKKKKKGLVYSALNPAVSFKPLWLPKVELGTKRFAEAQGKAAHLKTMATALTSR